jgi:hypothetical protein
MNEPVLITLVVISEAALHYFRWRETLQGRELPRLLAYALGVLGLMLPFTWWLVLNQAGKEEIIRVLWVVIVAGGLSVLLCYGLDWIVDMLWDLRQTKQREKSAINGLQAGSHAEK